MTFQISHAQGELLAQFKPNSASPETLFTAVMRTEITLIMAVVTSGAAAVDLELYHDDDGTTYNTTTQILNATIPLVGSGVIFQAQHPGSGIIMKPGGSIGGLSATIDTINLSLYGITETLAERVRGLT